MKFVFFLKVGCFLTCFYCLWREGGWGGVGGWWCCGLDINLCQSFSQSLSFFATSPIFVKSVFLQSNLSIADSGNLCLFLQDPLFLSKSVFLQSNLSIADMLYNGHLVIADTFLCNRLNHGQTLIEKHLDTFIASTEDKMKMRIEG